MRAVTPGRYQVPPTQVEDMYRPELRAVGEDIHEVTILSSWRLMSRRRLLSNVSSSERVRPLTFWQHGWLKLVAVAALAGAGFACHAGCVSRCWEL